jgi:isopentenyl diphosphate isomerase/L-lactate dehydrogenase-like FMN-dependent dehydrogenase
MEYNETYKGGIMSVTDHQPAFALVAATVLIGGAVLTGRAVGRRIGTKAAMWKMRRQFEAELTK